MPISSRNSTDWDADFLIDILSEYIDVEPANEPYLVLDGVKIIL